MVNNHKSLLYKRKDRIGLLLLVWKTERYPFTVCLFKLKCRCMMCEAHLQPKLLMVKDKTVQETRSLRQMLCANGAFKT